MKAFWFPTQRKVAPEPALRRMRIDKQRENGPEDNGPVRRIRRKGCSDLPPTTRGSSEEA